MSHSATSHRAASTSKAESILAAAFEQFRSYGYRRTSMEDIARGAGVSRPALYLHFRNKEEIFVCVSERLHEEALARAEQALEGEGDLEERVRKALEAKVTSFLRVIDTSAHGAELVDESSRLCADLAGSTEVRMQKLLAKAFREAAQAGELDLRGAGLGADSAAELIRLAAYGLKQPLPDVKTFGRRLKQLTAVFFAGLRPR